MVNPTHFAVTLARAVELFRTKPDAVPDLKAAIRALVATTKMGGAITTFERGVISVDATVIPETLPSIVTLKTQLEAHVIHEIRIARRASPADLLMLVRVLASTPGPAADQRVQRLDRDKGATVTVRLDETKKVPGRRPVSVTEAFEAEGILAAAPPETEEPSARPPPTPVERPSAAPEEPKRPLAPTAEEGPAEPPVGYQRPSAAIEARLRPSSGKVKAQPPKSGPAKKKQATPAAIDRQRPLAPPAAGESPPKPPVGHQRPSAAVEARLRPSSGKVQAQPPSPAPADPQRPLAAPAPEEQPPERSVGHQRPSAAVDARLHPITGPVEAQHPSAPPAKPDSPSGGRVDEPPSTARAQQGADLDRRVAKLRKQLAEERELVERLRRSRRELEQRITDTEASVGERKGFVAHLLDWFRKED